MKQNNKYNVVKSPNKNKVDKHTSKVEEMSLAGVANAAAGLAIAKGFESLVIRQEIKPVTKKVCTRTQNTHYPYYLRVNNMDNNAYGRSPSYEVQTGNVVYL